MLMFKNNNENVLDRIHFEWTCSDRYYNLLMISYREYIISDSYVGLPKEEREKQVHEMGQIVDFMMLIGGIKEK
jgi:hypothetical protein